MKVSLKTVQKIMDEVCENNRLDGDALEYHTDIENFNDKYIVRAYDPNSDRTLFVYISKPKTRYIYTTLFVSGDKSNNY